MNSDGSVKLGDLGVAKVMSGSFANTYVGTPYYLSPEMCEEKPYNEKSDIWALGCLLYEIITFKHPFNATNQGALALKIISGKFDPITNLISPDLRSTVGVLLEKNQNKRPTIEQFLEMDLIVKKIKEINLWEELNTLKGLEEINNGSYVKSQNNSNIESNEKRNKNICNNLFKKSTNASPIKLENNKGERNEKFGFFNIIKPHNQRQNSNLGNISSNNIAASNSNDGIKPNDKIDKQNMAEKESDKEKNKEYIKKQPNKQKFEIEKSRINKRSFVGNVSGAYNHLTPSNMVNQSNISSNGSLVNEIMGIGFPSNKKVSASNINFSQYFIKDNNILMKDNSKEIRNKKEDETKQKNLAEEETGIKASLDHKIISPIPKSRREKLSTKNIKNISYIEEETNIIKSDSLIKKGKKKESEIKKISRLPSNSKGKGKNAMSSILIEEDPKAIINNENKRFQRNNSNNVKQIKNNNKLYSNNLVGNKEEKIETCNDNRIEKSIINLGNIMKENIDSNKQIVETNTNFVNPNQVIKIETSKESNEATKKKTKGKKKTLKSISINTNTCSEDNIIKSNNSREIIKNTNNEQNQELKSSIIESKVDINGNIGTTTKTKVTKKKGYKTNTFKVEEGFEPTLIYHNNRDSLEGSLNSSNIKIKETNLRLTRNFSSSPKKLNYCKIKNKINIAKQLSVDQLVSLSQKTNKKYNIERNSDHSSNFSEISDTENETVVTLHKNVNAESKGIRSHIFKQSPGNTQSPSNIDKEMAKKVSNLNNNEKNKEVEDKGFNILSENSQIEKNSSINADDETEYFDLKETIFKSTKLNSILVNGVQDKGEEKSPTKESLERKISKILGDTAYQDLVNYYEYNKYAPDILEKCDNYIQVRFKKTLSLEEVTRTKEYFNKIIIADIYLAIKQS